jgi:hypothetical protein
MLKPEQGKQGEQSFDLSVVIRLPLFLELQNTPVLGVNKLFEAMEYFDLNKRDRG